MATLLATARVDADDVKEIIDTNLTDDQINAFINGANLLVQAKLLDKNLGDDLLTEIEKWLAAHFLSTRDQRVEREKVGGEWEATYQGKTEMGLDATTYGQQAKALDWSGTLATLGLKSISLEVYGPYAND